jgi:hypothetical protein
MTAPVPADQEEALRDRYTVVYEGDPDGMKILSGEPAPGRAVTVIVGDQWEEVATLRAERDQLASDLIALAKIYGEACGRLATARYERFRTDRRIRLQRFALREANKYIDKGIGSRAYVHLFQYAQKMSRRARSAEAKADQLASELREAEERVTRLHEARQSALRQMNEQQARADAAEQRGIELERGALHPALAIDVQQHRDEAYKTGWDDGYAEGHAKASALSDPRPSPAKGDVHHG